MTQDRNTKNAIRFGERMRGFTRFAAPDPDVRALYGRTYWVVNLRTLRAYYEKHTTPGQRDWDTFCAIVTDRIEAIN